MSDYKTPDEGRLRKLVARAGAKNPKFRIYHTVGVEELVREYANAGYPTLTMVVDTVDAHRRFIGVLYPGRSYGLSSKREQQITDVYREYYTSIGSRLPFGVVYSFGLRGGS